MSEPPRAAALRGLHVLADDGPGWPSGPVEQARAACAGGAAVVQLRAKRATDSEALAMAREIHAGRAGLTGGIYMDATHVPKETIERLIRRIGIVKSPTFRSPPRERPPGTTIGGDPEAPQ